MIMEAQACELKDNIVYQDKKSTVMMNKQGKASRGKRTNNINIRYFL